MLKANLALPSQIQEIFDVGEAKEKDELLRCEVIEFLNHLMADNVRSYLHQNPTTEEKIILEPVKHDDININAIHDNLCQFYKSIEYIIENTGIFYEKQRKQLLEVVGQSIFDDLPDYQNAEWA